MTTALGWLGALLASILALPQAVRLVRSRDTAGVPVLTWQVMLVINLSWAAHGILIGQASQIMSNLIGASASVVVLAVLNSRLPLGWLRILTPVVLGAAALIALDVVFGSTVFGVVVLAPAILLNGAQTLSLIRDPSVSGVSPVFLVLQTANQLVWAIWAAMLPDSGTLISAVTSGLIALVNLIWWLARRAGLGPLAARPVSS